MCTMQFLQIKSGNHTIATFCIINGVKQGCILFPILLFVYMDGLFEKLSESGISYRIGN